jgi:hypothetical protein
MRGLAILAPLAAVVAMAGAAAAQPASITISLGPDLQKQVEKLGDRDVNLQVEALRAAVTRSLSQDAALDGARIDLVLTDLKPNRPTFQQTADRPGLDSIRSISIGGAAIEGQITTADGTVQPVSFSRYSHNLADVRGYSTWQDAGMAFNRFARNLSSGRYVSR